MFGFGRFYFSRQWNDDFTVLKKVHKFKEYYENLVAK